MSESPSLLYKSFKSYFDEKSPTVFRLSEGTPRPNDTDILEEFQTAKELNSKTDNLHDFVDPTFKDYLKENLTKMVGHHKHFPLNYVGKSFDDIQYIVPEIMTTMWNNFKLTKLWLNQLKEDGLLKED